MNLSLMRFIHQKDQLSYNDFTLEQNNSFNFNGFKIDFAGLQKDIQHPQYQAEEEDVAIAAILNVTAPDGSMHRAQPVYFIRGNRPFNLKDQIVDLGLHFRFTSIDPATGKFQIKIAQSENTSPKIPIEIATNSLRTDYIIFEAIEFPGINLFWLGSVTMLLGMLLSMFNRRRGQKV